MGFGTSSAYPRASVLLLSLDANTYRAHSDLSLLIIVNFLFSFFYFPFSFSLCRSTIVSSNSPADHQRKVSVDENRARFMRHIYMYIYIYTRTSRRIGATERKNHRWRTTSEGNSTRSIVLWQPRFKALCQPGTVAGRLSEPH